MKLSYITVSVDYSDYLAVSHHHNQPHFDEFVVVTSPTDTATQAFCAKHNLTCVITDAFYRNGAVFNKGLALNEGLNATQHRDWFCIMDADTFVLPDFRSTLAGMELSGQLDRECMYGARRVLVPTWDDYQGLWSRDLESYKSPDGFAFGWLQLAHWDSQPMKAAQEGAWYPSGRDCREIDWRFREGWGGFDVPYTVPNRNLKELPFKVINIGPDGQNHFGRVSSPFIPHDQSS